MQVTNETKIVLGLPDGTSLPPGATKEVKDDLVKNRIVSAWLSKSMLTISGKQKAASKADDGGSEKEEADDKQAMINELAELGIYRDKRTSAENLKALLDEARAEQADDDA